MAVALVSGWILFREWNELPSVPASVAQSVQSEDVSILAEGKGANPGNDWEQSYVLVATSPDKNPVDAIEEALRSAGWATSRGIQIHSSWLEIDRMTAPITVSRFKGSIAS